MKNIIEYYYNIKIDKLYNKDDYYYFTIYDTNYILKPYTTVLDRSNDLYKLNTILSNNMNIDNIILNINNNPITSINNKDYILIRKSKEPQITLINISNLANQNTSYINDFKTLERNNWEILWSNMIDYYEIQIKENEKKYPLIRESFDYYIGLTENAISYVVNTKNTIPKDISDNKVISHNTLEKSLIDPENIILDHKARDVAEYIKKAFYDNNQNIYTELDEYFKHNYYSQYGIQILFGRVLYPSYYFNIYDKVISNKVKEEELNKIISKNKKYELYIYNIYSYLKRYYNIPLPEWLNPH